GEETGVGAFDALCDNLNSPAFESAVEANDEDINFLSQLMNSTVLQSLVQVHETLQDSNLKPVSCTNTELIQDVVKDIDAGPNNTAANELRDILTEPNFCALLESHDDIASKNYDAIPEAFPMFAPPPQEMLLDPNASDAIRMVGIRKNADEPLGITVRKEIKPEEDGEYLVIARILTGSMIDRQGLLQVGDVIKEVNGHEVHDPDQLQDIMKRCSGSVTLKVLPSFYDPSAFSQVYLKANFSFDPRRDNLIPCREAGLRFKDGDILQVVNMDDPNWWQARKVDDNGPSGLIPSQTLEEKRKAFVKPEYDYTHKSLLCGLVTKKKRKMMYQSRKNAEFDRTDLLIYEEVARMPPFQRKSLVLIGAQGVGRRSLKQRLIKADQSRFGSVIPHTSRVVRSNEVDGIDYHFMDPDDMQQEILENRFLEYGIFEDNYYGTKFESIRKVIQSGRMCVLDVNPQALKAIKTSEFMPFVVFVSAPPGDMLRNMHEFAFQRGITDKIRTERDFIATKEESRQIGRNYKHYFDLTIVNDNMDTTYNKLRQAIETLSTEPQWVPVSWVY
ncbi:MAGUK p55 subfamily member 6, partial [Lamellibrachia satsuma]